MPSAIPAAIGLGGSLIGGITGKGAAKKQQKLAEQQLAEQKRQYAEMMSLYKPMQEYGLGKSKEFLGGAQEGISDLEKFWGPLLGGDRSAIDKFLSPERRAINEGYSSAVTNIGRMAPRGGGRVSALANADVTRQGKLSDLVYGARKDAANAKQGLAGLQGQLGSSLFGNTMGPLAGLLGNAGNRQSSASQSLSDIYGSRASGLGDLGKSLGGFLTDIFSGKGASPSKGFGYGRNPLGDTDGSFGD